MNKSKPTVIDDYLSALDVDKRAALEKLRKTIKAVAPKAEECISYGLAVFRLNGKALVAFGATKNHCAFFPMNSTTVAAFEKELKNFDTSKGTIRFQPDRPLPEALVRKLVKSRIAENDGKSAQTKSTSKKVKKADARSVTGNAQADPAVEAFLKKLNHPLKPEIEAVRQIILGLDPSIQEGIKWNSPSFRTTDYFATLNLRAKDCKERVWLILHGGAKAKGLTLKDKIADPTGLLEWLANDRCLVTFDNHKDVQSKSRALQSIIREWIRHLK